MAETVYVTTAEVRMETAGKNTPQRTQTQTQDIHTPPVTLDMPLLSPVKAAEPERTDLELIREQDEQETLSAGRVRTQTLKRVTNE